LQRRINRLQKGKTILLFISLLIAVGSFCQTQISIATDITALHSLKKDQRFWAFGQTIQAQFHFTPKDGAYVWYSYYSPGRFKNNLNAIAKSNSTNPQAIAFISHAEIDLKEFSIGWRHYLKGAYDDDGTWNLYYLAGFGIEGGKVTNTYSATIDTSLYQPPSNPVSGIGKFSRLTFDLGLGYEIPIGMSIYLYGEGRILIPTTEYPSQYLLVNNSAPLAGTLSIGLRILFD
jgi:hypothetical protein